jgi:hypothetical protein
MESKVAESPDSREDPIDEQSASQFQIPILPSRPVQPQVAKPLHQVDPSWALAPPPPGLYKRPSQFYPGYYYPQQLPAAGPFDDPHAQVVAAPVEHQFYPANPAPEGYYPDQAYAPVHPTGYNNQLFPDEHLFAVAPHYRQADHQFAYYDQPDQDPFEEAYAAEVEQQRILGQAYAAEIEEQQIAQAHTAEVERQQILDASHNPQIESPSYHRIYLTPSPNIETSFLGIKVYPWPERLPHLAEQVFQRDAARQAAPPSQPDQLVLHLSAHLWQVHIQQPDLQIRVAEIPQQPVPAGVFLQWLATNTDNMVGKKSGKALLREEGTIIPFLPSQINKADSIYFSRPRTYRQWYEAVELARAPDDQPEELLHVCITFMNSYISLHPAGRVLAGNLPNSLRISPTFIEADFHCP